MCIAHPSLTAKLSLLLMDLCRRPYEHHYDAFTSGPSPAPTWRCPILVYLIRRLRDYLLHRASPCTFRTHACRPARCPAADDGTIVAKAQARGRDITNSVLVS